MTDKFKDECGVFGIMPHPEAAEFTYYGLYSLQHRGQESTGIVANRGGTLHSRRKMGLVSDAFNDAILSELKGSAAIGHVRYSTAGTSRLENAQPILITCQHGQIALAHNGNLVNATALRAKLESQGSIFNSDSDSEVVLHLIARSKQILIEDAIAEALSQVEGAYSMVFLTQDKMIGVRDPSGFRPLVLGQLGDSQLFASETCAFDLLDAQFVRDVEPGELVSVNERGLIKSHQPFPPQPTKQCIFEHIYFARPDGMMFGESTQGYRDRLGRKLAEENPVDADLVIPVPDSGVGAAIGYAAESKIPLVFGLIRNHYVGRTFIHPTQAIRDLKVKVKLNPVRELITGKRVILVDDSVVRGTTSRKIVKMVRAAGAAEVHLRISSPPTRFPCFYGINTPTRKELIASSHDIDEICKYIGADSLAYVSREGMFACLKNSSAANYCDACFSGEYAIENATVKEALAV